MKHYTKITNIFVAVLICMAFAHISYAKSMKQVLQSMKDSITQEGDYGIDEQGRYGWVGGHLNYAAGSSETLQFFDLRGPSIKAGCSGIDLDFGAYQFLMDPDRLIAFLEKVVAQAPGYFVGLAMQTLCPQCKELMDKLNSLMNMINGMQLDSCAALDAISGLAGSALKDTAVANVASGIQTEFGSAVKKTVESLDKFQTTIADTLNRMNCFLGDVTRCPIEYLQPNSEESLLTILAKNTFIDDDSSDIEILRYLVGDAYVIPGSGEEKTQPYIKCDGGTASAVVSNDFDTKDYLRTWSGIKILIKNKDESDNRTKNFEEKAKVKLKGKTFESKELKEETFDVDPIRNMVVGYFKNIVDAFAIENVNRRIEIDQKTISFLGTFNYPIYQTINQLSVDPKLLTSYLETFTNLATATYHYEMLLDIFKPINQFMQKAKDASNNPLVWDEKHGKCIDEITQRFKIVLAIAYEIYAEEYQYFLDNVKTIENRQKFKALFDAQVARSPLFGTLLMGKMLGVQTLGTGH